MQRQSKQSVLGLAGLHLPLRCRHRRMDMWWDLMTQLTWSSVITWTGKVWGAGLAKPGQSEDVMLSNLSVTDALYRQRRRANLPCNVILSSGGKRCEMNDDYKIRLLQKVHLHVPRCIYMAFCAAMTQKFQVLSATTSPKAECAKCSWWTPSQWKEQKVRNTITFAAMLLLSLTVDSKDDDVEVSNFLISAIRSQQGAHWLCNEGVSC